MDEQRRGAALERLEQRPCAVEPDNGGQRPRRQRQADGTPVQHGVHVGGDGAVQCDRAPGREARVKPDRVYEV
jgi:hypothetical protein